jgi:putative intracellular protease/amidase
MMNKILVFIFNEMTDYEITLISHLLNTTANKEIITISYEDKIIKGRSGFLYKPSRLVTDVLNEDVDGLILTGGWYGDTRPEILELINNLNSKGKLISAICGAGTIFLAKSGILNIRLLFLNGLKNILKFLERMTHFQEKTLLVKE